MYFILLSPTNSLQFSPFQQPLSLPMWLLLFKELLLIGPESGADPVQVGMKPFKAKCPTYQQHNHNEKWLPRPQQPLTASRLRVNLENHFLLHAGLFSRIDSVQACIGDHRCSVCISLALPRRPWFLTPFPCFQLHVLSIVSLFVCLDSISLCRPGCPEARCVDQAGHWPRTHRDMPASTSQIPGLKACMAHSFIFQFQ